MDVSSNIDFLYKMEVTSSESKDYMVIPGKGVTNYLDLRTKRPNKQQNERFHVNDITNHFFSEVNQEVS